MENITFFGLTDVGRKRENNEDAVVIQRIWDDNHILAVAIDGVGGYEGGEVASAMAGEKIVEYLEKYRNGERIDLLKQAVVYANNEIHNARKENPTLSNMSCVLTAVIVEVKQRRINMAHVGDTRLYRLAGGVYTKLSHDQSLVGYREEIGELTEEEAMRHPQRNIISQDVGSRELSYDDQDYIEVATFDINTKSTQLLLCSDGLCDMVMSYQMQSLLETDITTEEKVKALIEAANIAGGKDNITVIVIDLQYDEAIDEEPIAPDDITHITDKGEEATEAEEKEDVPPEIETVTPTPIGEGEMEQHAATSDTSPAKYKRIITTLVLVIALLLVGGGYAIFSLMQRNGSEEVVVSTAATTDSIDTKKRLLTDGIILNAELSALETIINDTTLVNELNTALNDSSVTIDSLTIKLSLQQSYCDSLRDSINSLLLVEKAAESDTTQVMINDSTANTTTPPAQQ